MLHLTLSNIIIYQNDKSIGSIRKIQDALVADINVSNKMSENKIFKCPAKIIHHSLVNFFPPSSLSRADYEKEKGNSIKEVDKTIRNNLNIIRDKNIVIKSIYIGEKSIALEAFPSNNILDFAHFISTHIHTVEGYPVVKGYPTDSPIKFAINLIRFPAHGLNNSEITHFGEIATFINNELSAQPISFDLKSLCLVISNDYLTNTDPVVCKYYI